MRFLFFKGDMKNSLLQTMGICALVLLSTSCSKIGHFAERKADDAAYGNIRGAQLRSMGDAEPFSIDAEQIDLVRELLEMDKNAEDPELLSLAQALTIAMSNSRSYQTRKEDLFFEALNLTEVQKDFNWDFSASASYQASSGTSKDGSIERFGDSASAGLGLTRKLASGAKVSLGVTENLLSYAIKPNSYDGETAVSLNVVQPLLNGFGPLVTKEPLRQAERNMIYEVREFKRYQQGFVIEITQQYYSALRSRDQLENERKNYESSIANREQTESFAKAGRIADFEAAQARQKELDAADRWTASRSAYQKALDDFRFTLGLPIDLKIEPDPAELTQLEERGLVELEIDLSDAVDSAVSNRLDLITRREKVEDKARKLEIQERNFMPQLDVSYGITKSVDNQASAENLQLKLDLPFDWTEKRNAYRKAQINLDREERELEQDESDVRRTVRDLWRKLERNRSVYNNRLLSVQLSERRVENTELLLQQGKALTRDVLDAQDDLLSSRNAATVALVDFTINRLRFWNAIERFEIDPEGMWYEQSEPEE
jgi:outer membrane protein TolC